jgi:hypothetical protein
MKITAEDAAALYSEQSVADYVAEPVVVNLPEDIQVSAVCYNLPATMLAGTYPEYAAALLTLACTLGLPASCVHYHGKWNGITIPGRLQRKAWLRFTPIEYSLTDQNRNQL